MLKQTLYHMKIKDMAQDLQSKVQLLEYQTSFPSSGLTGEGRTMETWGTLLLPVI